MNLVLPVHVAAGGLALALGAVALLAKKGGTIHHRELGLGIRGVRRE